MTTPTDSSSLARRWGFEPAEQNFVWNGSSSVWVGSQYGTPMVVPAPGGWRLVQTFDEDPPDERSEIVQHPWQAAQKMMGVLRTHDLLTQRQYEMLVRLGKAFRQPWASAPPWGGLLPWSEGLSLSWLRVAANELGMLDGLPKPNYVRRDGRPSRTGEDVLRHADEYVVEDGRLELVVNPRGEVLVDLYQPSPSYLHWSQLHHAAERCGDLPLAHDLLLAALPPQPEEGKDLAAWARVVLGDLELKRFTELSLEQVQHLRKGIMATVDAEPEPTIRPDRLRLARRLGEELEAQLPSYHPDMDLWFQIRTEPEVHLLLWRDQVIGECHGTRHFEFTGSRPELSIETLRSWISKMAPQLPETELNRILG